MRRHAWVKIDEESPTEDLLWVRCTGCGLRVLTSLSEVAAGTVDPGLYSSDDCELEPGYTLVNKVMSE